MLVPLLKEHYDAGALVCSHCPPDQWSPVNSVSKDACYPLSAMKKSKVNAFVLCPAGYAPNDNDVCTACLIGSYALAGSAECTQC